MMTALEKHQKFLPANLGACILLGAVAALFPSAASGGSFYAGPSVESHFAEVDYEKTIAIGVEPPSLRLSSDRDAAQLRAGTLVLGYRRALSGRVYLSAEIEGVLHLNDRAAGFLPGTGVGERDVWPGRWTVEKDRGAGLAARVGHSPHALRAVLGKEACAYLVAGIRWLRVDAMTSYDNGTRTGQSRRILDTYPWSAGFGLSAAALGGQVRVEMRRSRYSFHWGVEGGAAIDEPMVRYEFEAADWQLRIGYTRRLARPPLTG